MLRFFNRIFPVSLSPHPLPEEKGSDEEGRQAPRQAEMVDMANPYNQRDREVNHQKPEKRKLFEFSPEITKGKIDKKSGNASV
jgi:hypothetical protein